MHSQKIRVVYLPPEGQTVPEEDESHANMSSLLHVPGQDVSLARMSPPFPSSPNLRLQNFATVRQNPYTNGHATREPSADGSAVLVPPPQEETHHDAPSSPPHVTVFPPEVIAVEPQPSSDEGVGIVNVNVHTPAPAPVRVSPPPSPPHVRREVAPPPPPQVIIQDPNPELMKKLEEAQSEIERLRSLIASMPEPSVAPTSVTGASELRHRRRAPMSDDGSDTYDGRSEYDGRTEVGSYVGSEIAPPDGVPLQVVIIIALGVFVTTYLFF